MTYRDQPRTGRHPSDIAAPDPASGPPQTRRPQQSRQLKNSDSRYPNHTQKTKPLGGSRFTLPIPRRSKTSTSQSVPKPKEWSVVPPKRTINAVRQASVKPEDTRIKRKSKGKKKQLEKVEISGPFSLDGPEEGRWENGRWVDASSTQRKGQAEAVDKSQEQILNDEDTGKRTSEVFQGNRESSPLPSKEVARQATHDLTHRTPVTLAESQCTQVHLDGSFGRPQPAVKEFSRRLRRTDTLLQEDSQGYAGEPTGDPKQQSSIPLMAEVRPARQLSEPHPKVWDDKIVRSWEDDLINPESIGRPSTRRFRVYNRVQDPEDIPCLNDISLNSDDRLRESERSTNGTRTPHTYPISHMRDDPMPYLENGTYTRDSPPPLPFCYSDALTQDTDAIPHTSPLPHPPVPSPSSSRRKDHKLKRYTTYSKRQPQIYAIPNLSSQALDDGMSYHYDRHKRAGSTSVWPNSAPEPSFNPQYNDSPSYQSEIHGHVSAGAEDEGEEIARPGYREARGRKDRNGPWPDAAVVGLFSSGEDNHDQTRQYLQGRFVPLTDRFHPDHNHDVPEPPSINREKRRMYRYGDPAFGRIHHDLGGPRLTMTKSNDGIIKIDR